MVGWGDREGGREGEEEGQGEREGEGERERTFTEEDRREIKEVAIEWWRKREKGEAV